MKTKSNIRDITYIAIFAAIIAILSQISLPIGPVPFTLQTFAVPLAGIILGRKRGTISTIIYLLLGCVGVPVFAGFTGGIQNLVGPTGGFLLGFPLYAFFAGLGIHLFHGKGKYVRLIACLIVGCVIDYVLGCLIFVLIGAGNLAAAMTYCVIPFIIPEIAKVALACFLGITIRNALVNARLLEEPAQA